MKKIFIFSFIVMTLHSCCIAQENITTVELIRQNFKAFEYQIVIQLAEQLLRQKDNLPEPEVLDIYYMRAVSYFSTGQINQSMNDFLAILARNPNFTLDPMQTSPKILKFFDDLKANFLVSQQQKADSSDVINHSELVNNQMKLNSSFLHSVIVPGWGHLKLGKKKKGWTFLSLNIVNIGLASYYIYNTSQKETDYLNETNISRIESKYNQYNAAYRMRNICLTSFAVIWLACQTDLFYFSRPMMSKKISAVLTPHISNESCFVHFALSF